MPTSVCDVVKLTRNMFQAPSVHTALPAVNNSRASGDMRTTYRVGSSFHSRLIANRTLQQAWQKATEKKSKNEETIHAS